MLQIVLYFLIGLGLDIIITFYYLKIAQGAILWASLLSFMVTIINLVVYDKIILGKRFWARSVAFALGCAIGTGLAVFWG